jgi:transcriptional regulator with XRE-family HTH domain
MIIFAERLLMAMKGHGMTQTEFAARSGCSLTEIGHWVSGRRQPGVTNLARLARALPETNILWLVTGVAETRIDTCLPDA